MVKLILNSHKYPDAFKTLRVPATIIDKQSYFESLMIAGLNKTNNKLKIESVEYVDLKIDYQLNQEQSGVIVSKNQAKKNVLAYVFLSQLDYSSRNTFVAQSIFPDLIDKMRLYLKSPSFTMLNHPIFFINMVNGNTVANSIRRDIALLVASGFHYVELFEHKAIDIHKIPNNADEFVNEYFKKLSLEIKFFQLKDLDKKLKILFPKGKLLKGNNFNGSSEKFFWTEILPISIIAIKSGFQIDIEEYENFINTYESIFSPSNDKMKRCKILLEFIKKLQLKKYYDEL